MADSDKRLEALEDELKLLKGEVKRTLVDLRAIVMREDSPLNERLPVAAPVSETIIREKVESEKRVDALEEELKSMKRSTSDTSSPAPSIPQPAPFTPQPPPPAAPFQGYPAGFNYGPPGQQFSAPVNLQGTQAAPDYSSFTGHGPQPSRQEAEKYIETETRENPPKRSGTSTGGREGPVEVREQDDVDYPVEVVARGPNRRREDAEEYQNDDDQTRPAKGVRAQTGRRDSLEGDPGRQNENQSPQEPRSRRTRRDHTQGTPSVAPERRREHQMEETPRAQEGRRNGHHWESDQLEDEDWDLTYPEDSGHDRIAPIRPDFYDINLTANLLRWAFQAKRRMGHERLMELLSLYLRSGHYSRELKEMISYICNMVEEDGAGVGEPDPSQEWVNLIHQLHGILAGGIPITHGHGLKFADGNRSDGAERTSDSGV